MNFEKEINDILKGKDEDKLWKLLRLLQRLPGFIDSSFEKKSEDFSQRIVNDINGELKSKFQDLSFLCGKILETELKPQLKKELEYVKINVDNELKRLKAIKVLKGDKGEQGKDGKTPIKGVDYKDGEDGYTPIKGKDYFDGIDGINGKDADEEKIVNKVLKKIPKPKDGSPDTPNEIVKKINESSEKIDASKIKNLPTQKKSGGGGGMTIRSYDLTAFCNGVTKTFTIPLNNGVLGAWSTQSPQIYRPLIDFTYTDSQLVLTSEVSAPDTGQTLWIQYIEQ